MKRRVNAGGRRIEYTLVQAVRPNVMLKVLPEKGIWVYAPKSMHLREIDRLVCERADQLGDMQRQVDGRLEADRRAHPVTDGSPILIEGRRRALKLSVGSRARGAVNGDAFELALPRPEDDAAVRAAIRAVLSRMALARIRERLAFYAPRVGGRFGRVTIREQKTRWGSCTGKGNLNFNWKLIMAPPQCLDYVVIHELCHLHEFNHSPRFWALVSGQMPEYDVWRKWLKRHAEDLYL